MPKLPAPYTADLGGVAPGGGRRASVEDFGSGAGFIEAGRAIKTAADEYMAEIQSAEARRALVASTEIRAQYARKLDEATLSGADVGSLKEQMLGELSKVGEGFQTKKGQEQLQLYTANSELMFDEQANSIKVQRAWSDAKLQGQAFVNGASALIQSNPAYLAEAERNAEDFIKTYPGIRPDQRAELTNKLKQDLNMAAAMSAARIEPEAAIKRLEGGEWNITDEQRRTGISYAERNLSTRRAAEDREVHRVEKARRDAADAARDSYSQRILGGDLGKKLERDIIADPAFAQHPQYREHLVLLLRADARMLAAEAADRPVRTNPAVFNDLRERIGLPAGDDRALRDPSAIWKEYGTRLSKADAEDLERQMRENRSASGQKWAAAESEFLRNMKSQLDKSTLVRLDTQGGARMQAFTQYLRDKVEEYKTEKKDPYSLLNPNSKDYVGNAVPMFQSGPQRGQRDMADKLNRALTPKPRPSLDDIFNKKP